MDEKMKRDEGLWQTEEETHQSAPIPIIEEIEENDEAAKGEKTHERSSPTVCGACREYLAQMSAATSANNRPLSPAGWIGVNFLMLIPPVNVLFLFLWACGGTERTSLKNYARGVLLTVVLLVLIFLAAVVVLEFCGVRIVLPDNIKELLR